MVVGYGYVFAEAFVDVYVWCEVFLEVVVGCGADDGCAGFAGLALEVVGDDFCGVSVEEAAEFVEYPPGFCGFGEFGDLVAVFLSIAELVVGAEEEECVV